MKALDRDAHVLQGVARLLFNQVVLYGQAARAAQEASLRVELGKAQAERALLLEDVNRKISAIGAELPNHGTMIGTGERILLNGRIYVECEGRAVLGEVERGEDLLKDQITKRIEHNNLSAHTHNFLRTILSRITPLHEEIACLNTPTRAWPDRRNK